jgi:hypothetical protein
VSGAAVSMLVGLRGVKVGCWNCCTPLWAVVVLPHFWVADCCDLISSSSSIILASALFCPRSLVFSSKTCFSSLTSDRSYNDSALISSSLTVSLRSCWYMVSEPGTLVGLPSRWASSSSSIYLWQLVDTKCTTTREVEIALTVSRVPVVWQAGHEVFSRCSCSAVHSSASCGFRGTTLIEMKDRGSVVGTLGNLGCSDLLFAAFYG